jgi:hypothetical protein
MTAESNYRFGMRRIIFIIFLAGTLAAAAGIWYLYRAPYAAGARFPAKSEAAITRFTAQTKPTRDDYLTLVGYVVEGFLTYSTPSHALADYPGLPAGGARKAEEFEGFSRVEPLLGAWLEHASATTITLPSGREVDAARILESGVLAGTDPGHADYWGDITDNDQRIAEAADVALALWLSRASVWDRLDANQRQQIARWLLQVNGKAIADNNWHLFVAQINVALESLGAKFDAQVIERHLARTLDFYRGDGWFTDGPEGPIDYYNAWGFYYHIGWIHRMNSGLLGETVTSALPLFAADLMHLLGPHGLPVMGRSVCYRMAVPAPLIFASTLHPESLPPAIARRALDVTWDFFLEHGALRDGRVTQGYCGDDAAMLDNYSGPASCLWSLRSLVVALDLAADSEFWTQDAAPLPVEQGDFERRIAGGRWLARGDASTGDVTLVNPQPLPEAQTGIEPFGLVDRAISAVRGGPRRPHNEGAKYGKATYGSRRPFCGCTASGAEAAG